MSALAETDVGQSGGGQAQIVYLILALSACGNSDQRLSFIDSATIEQIGKRAEDISPEYGDWTFTTNMLGYDYYFDESAQCAYLFPGDGSNLNDMSECLGILTALEIVFVKEEFNQGITIEQIEGKFDVIFEWLANHEEEQYAYIANIELNERAYHFMIYTDSKHCCWSCGQQRWKSNTVCGHCCRKT